MTSSNWIKIIIAVIIGIALGLDLWLGNPTRSNIQMSHQTFCAKIIRADYVLMVAEAHQSEQDSETAARRLAILGSESPAQIVASTLDYATNNGFTQNEIFSCKAC